MNASPIQAMSWANDPYASTYGYPAASPSTYAPSQYTQYPTAYTAPQPQVASPYGYTQNTGYPTQQPAYQSYPQQPMMTSPAPAPQAWPPADMSMANPMANPLANMPADIYGGPQAPDSMGLPPMDEVMQSSPSASELNLDKMPLDFQQESQQPAEKKKKGLLGWVGTLAKYAAYILAIWRLVDFPTSKKPDEGLDELGPQVPYQTSIRTKDDQPVILATDEVDGTTRYTNAYAWNEAKRELVVVPPDQLEFEEDPIHALNEESPDNLPDTMTREKFDQILSDLKSYVPDYKQAG